MFSRRTLFCDVRSLVIALVNVLLVGSMLVRGMCD